MLRCVTRPPSIKTPHGVFATTLAMNSSLEKYLSYLSGRSVVRLVTVQLGVWDVTYRETSKPLLPGLPSKDDFKGFSELIHPLRTFLKEIYHIAPKQLAMHIVDMAWSSLDSGLSLYASGFLMNAVCLLFSEMSDPY